MERPAGAGRWEALCWMVGWDGRSYSLFRKQKGGEATLGTDSEATSAGDLGADSEAHSATRAVQKIVLDICHKMC